MYCKDREEELAIRSGAYAQLAQNLLNNNVMLPDGATEEAKIAERNSDIHKLFVAFLNLAKEHCEAAGLEPDPVEAGCAFREAEAMASLIVNDSYSLPFDHEERKRLSPQEVAQKMALAVPSHVTDLLSYVKEFGAPAVNIDHLSVASGDYVRGRFKSVEIDRIIALFLVRSEIAWFTYDITVRKQLSGRSKLEDAKPPSSCSAVWSVLKAFIVLWLVAFGIVASPTVNPAFADSTTAMIGLGLGIFGSAVLFAILVIRVNSILRVRPSRKKRYAETLNLLDQMNGFYLEFRIGPFSLAHFTRRVNDLSDAGVVWPSGLFVLIDDMKARGVVAF